jgi:hypothetical protein
VRLHNVGKLLQRHIRYNSNIFGNERGRCNEGWLYFSQNYLHSGLFQYNYTLHLIYVSIQLCTWFSGWHLFTVTFRKIHCQFFTVFYAWLSVNSFYWVCVICFSVQSFSSHSHLSIIWSGLVSSACEVKGNMAVLLRWSSKSGRCHPPA